MKFHVPLVIKTRYILDTASKCPYMQRLLETIFSRLVGILGAGHNVKVKDMDWWSPQNDDPHGRSMFFYIYRVETTKRSWILLDYCIFSKVLVDSCTDTNTFFAFLDLWLVPSHIIIVVLYSPRGGWFVTLMPSLQVFSGRGNLTGAAAQGEKIGSYPPSLATFARNVGEEYFRGDLCVFLSRIPTRSTLE